MASHIFLLCNCVTMHCRLFQYLHPVYYTCHRGFKYSDLNCQQSWYDCKEERKQVTQTYDHYVQFLKTKIYIVKFVNSVNKYDKLCRLKLCMNNKQKQRRPINLHTIFRHINLLTPNVNYSGRTAPLTSKVAFYIFIQQI